MAILGTRKAHPVVAAALLHSLLVNAHGPSSCKLVEGWGVFTKQKSYALHAWVEAGGAALDPAHAILARSLGQADVGQALGIVLTLHEPDPAAFKPRDDDRQRDEFRRHLEAYRRQASAFWKQAPPTVQLKRRMLQRKLGVS